MKKIKYVSAIGADQRKELEKQGYTVLFSNNGTNVIKKAKEILVKKQVQEYKEVKVSENEDHINKYFERVRRETLDALKKKRRT